MCLSICHDSSDFHTVHGCIGGHAQYIAINYAFYITLYALTDLSLYLPNINRRIVSDTHLDLHDNYYECRALFYRTFLREFAWPQSCILRWLKPLNHWFYPLLYMHLFLIANINRIKQRQLYIGWRFALNISNIRFIFGVEVNNGVFWVGFIMP